MTFLKFIIALLCVCGVFIKWKSMASSETCGLFTNDRKSGFISSQVDFTLNLYKTLVKRNESKNLAFSPSSIASVLCMVLDASRGNSRKELQKHFPGCSRYCLRASYAWYMPQMNASQENYELLSRNGLMIDGNLKNFKQILRSGETYLEIFQKCYSAVQSWKNFTHTGVQEEVVTRRKRDKGENLIEIEAQPRPSGHDKLTVVTISDVATDQPSIVLFNSLIFEADWLLPFTDEGKTFDSYFYPIQEDPSSYQKIKMMILIKQALYYEDEQVKVLGLPYVDKKMTMFFLQPRGLASIGSLEKRLKNGKVLSKLIGEVVWQNVSVTIPKFTLSQTIQLDEVLDEMDVEGIFSKKRARFNFFSRKNETKLYVSAAVHKATIEVNEQGTESAVPYSSKYFCSRGSDSPVFWASSPFIFLVYKEATESILFMGRITDADSLPSTKTRKR